MPIPITATIEGHPWDLWGLSKLFDGTDSTHTRVIAQKPKGRPSFDPSDPAAVARFRAHGYNISATIRSDELFWHDNALKPDLRDLRENAVALLARINGLGHALDHEFRSATLKYLSFQTATSSGSMPLGDWEPNRSETYLGGKFQPEFAREILTLSASDTAIRFVLDALALPRTWASLYLIYDAIAADVGGVHELKKLGWVAPELLSDFTNSANNSRSIREGARHGKKPDAGRPLIPLTHACVIVNNLALQWLDWVRSKRTN
jgi:hypothetical protein